MACFHDIPAEILLILIEILTPGDVLAFASTCRLVHELSTDRLKSHKELTLTFRTLSTTPKERFYQSVYSLFIDLQNTYYVRNLTVADDDYYQDSDDEPDLDVEIDPEITTLSIPPWRPQFATFKDWWKTYTAPIPDHVCDGERWKSWLARQEEHPPLDILLQLLPFLGKLQTLTLINANIDAWSIMLSRLLSHIEDQLSVSEESMRNQENFSTSDMGPSIVLPGAYSSLTKLELENDNEYGMGVDLYYTFLALPNLKVLYMPNVSGVDPSGPPRHRTKAPLEVLSLDRCEFSWDVLDTVLMCTQPGHLRRFLYAHHVLNPEMGTAKWRPQKYLSVLAQHSANSLEDIYLSLDSSCVGWCLEMFLELGDGKIEAGTGYHALGVSEEVNFKAFSRLKHLEVDACVILAGYGLAEICGADRSTTDDLPEEPSLDTIPPLATILPRSLNYLAIKCTMLQWNALQPKMKEFLERPQASDLVMDICYEQLATTSEDSELKTMDAAIESGIATHGQEEQYGNYFCEMGDRFERHESQPSTDNRSSKSKHPDPSTSLPDTLEELHIDDHLPHHLNVIEIEMYSGWIEEIGFENLTNNYGSYVDVRVKPTHYKW